ncbi:MAG: DUF4439 domain-containing protein [Parasphingopyxis sp.]
MDNIVNDRAKPVGRRGFIRNATAGGLSLAAVSLLSGESAAAQRGRYGRATPADAQGDTDLLNAALGLEHEGIAAYTIAAGSGLLEPAVVQVGVLFRGHHRQHRDELARVIRTLGGVPVEPKSDAEYVEALDLGSLRNQTDVLNLALRLERGATAAYLGIMPSLQDGDHDHLAARIAVDEAAHFAALAGALGQSMPENGFIFG